MVCTSSQEPNLNGFSHFLIILEFKYTKDQYDPTMRGNFDRVGFTNC